MAACSCSPGQDSTGQANIRAPSPPWQIQGQDRLYRRRALRRRRSRTTEFRPDPSGDRWRARRAPRLFAFDLLHLSGWDVSSLPLIRRKELLEPLITNKPGLQFNGHDTGDGELILKHAAKLGFEGVVSKTIDAPYAPETAACGARPKRSIARSSSSSDGQIQKDHGLISEHYFSATTAMTASLSMPAALARECPTRFLRICDSALTR